MKLNRIALSVVTVLLIVAPLCARQIPSGYSRLFSIEQYDLHGVWVAADKDLQIEIYSNGGKYYGKNKDGHMVLSDFVYDPEENAYHGKLRSAEGNELQATITFTDQDTIKLTARKLVIRKTYVLSRIKP